MSLYLENLYNKQVVALATTNSLEVSAIKALGFNDPDSFLDYLKEYKSLSPETIAIGLTHANILFSKAIFNHIHLPIEPTEKHTVLMLACSEANLYALKYLFNFEFTVMQWGQYWELVYNKEGLLYSDITEAMASYFLKQNMPLPSNIITEVLSTHLEAIQITPLTFMKKAPKNYKKALLNLF